MAGLFIAISLLATQIQAMNCPVVACTRDMSNGQCYKYSTELDKIYFQGCEGSQICSLTNEVGTAGKSDLLFRDQSFFCAKAITSNMNRIPGEPCESDTECRAKNCSDGFCKGNGVDTRCSTTIDCNVGLACSLSLKVCVQQSAEGQQCNQDVECVNDCGCHDGRCVKYFSLPNGTKVDKANTTHHICSSGYINRGTSVCDKAPSNKLDATDPCQTDSDCQLTGNLQGRCDCGLNLNGNAYCRAVSGDQEFLDFVAAHLKIMEINSACHSESSYDGRCPSIANTPELQDMLTKFNIFVLRPSFIEVPPCVTQVTQIEYTDQGSNDSGGDGSSDDEPNILIIVVGCVIGVVLLILILAIVVMILRKQLASRTQRTVVEESPNSRRPDLELELAPSQVQQSPNAASITKTPTSVFKMDDIRPNADDSIYLATGIPIANDPQAAEQLDYVIADQAEVTGDGSCSSRSSYNDQRPQAMCEEEGSPVPPNHSGDFDFDPDVTEVDYN